MISLTFAPVGVDAVNRSKATSATAPLDSEYDQSQVAYDRKSRLWSKKQVAHKKKRTGMLPIALSCLPIPALSCMSVKVFHAAAARPRPVRRPRDRRPAHRRDVRALRAAGTADAPLVQE